MASKRMFAKSIIDSDSFLEMPASSQALYFHLSMRADDEGFIDNPKKVTKIISCSEDDLKLLIAKRYVIVFESGVIVIKHWKLHNYIRKDRLKETLYQEEKKQLAEKPNGAYTTNIYDHKNLVSGRCQADVRQMSGRCQHSIDKVSIDKVSIDKNTSTKTIPKQKYLESVLLTKKEYEKLVDRLGQKQTDEMIEALNNYIGSKGKKYKSHYHTILAWHNKELKKNENAKTTTGKFAELQERDWNKW